MVDVSAWVNFSKILLSFSLLDSDPRVFDDDRDSALTRVALRPGDLDGHLPGVGELDRVPDEVGEDLPHPPRVSQHPSWGVGTVACDHLDALGVRPGGKQLTHVLGSHEQIVGQVFEIQVSGLDLREVQNVVDDREQVVRGPLDRLSLFLLVGREIPRQHEAVHADDCR